jgi:hypothetical protein
MQRYLRECTALADKHYLAIFLCLQPRTRSRADCHQLDQHWFHARITLTPIQSIFFPSADCNTLHIPSPDRGHLHPHHWVRSGLPLATTGFFFLQPGSFLFLLFIWQVLVFLVWLKRDLSLLCGAFGQSQPI